jgi:PAS domain-containing protein
MERFRLRAGLDAVLPGEIQHMNMFGFDDEAAACPETEFRAVSTLFGLAAQSPTLTEFAENLLDHFEKYSGCGCVGIRIHDDGGYPFLAQKGFSREFPESENSSLSSQAGDGGTGPMLTGICDNVMGGRFDPSQPFYTKAGSFWTNSISRLLSTAAEGILPTKPGEADYTECFESVALIPIGGGSGNIGIIQLSDEGPELFTPALIEFFERQGRYISEIIKASYFSNIVSYRHTLQYMFDSIPDAVFALNPGGKIILSNRAARSFLFDNDDFPGKSSIKDIQPAEASGKIQQMMDFVAKSQTQVRFILDTAIGSIDCTMRPVVDTRGRLVLLAVFGHFPSDRAHEVRSGDAFADFSESNNLADLKGYIPICASCRKIRDDNGEWYGLEEYIRFKTKAEFSHCVCPECAGKLYPGLFNNDDQ